MTKIILTAALSAALLVPAISPSFAKSATTETPVLITVKSDRGGGTHSPLAQAIFDAWAKE